MSTRDETEDMISVSPCVVTSPIQDAAYDGDSDVLQTESTDEDDISTVVPCSEVEVEVGDCDASVDHMTRRDSGMSDDGSSSSSIDRSGCVDDDMMEKVGVLGIMEDDDGGVDDSLMFHTVSNRANAVYFSVIITVIIYHFGSMNYVVGDVVLCAVSTLICILIALVVWTISTCIIMMVDKKLAMFTNQRDE